MKYTFQKIAPSQISRRQMLVHRERIRQRLFYLVQIVMSDAQRRNYNEETKSRLAKSSFYPPHHLETHMPNQGCLFCLMETAEDILVRE